MGPISESVNMSELEPDPANANLHCERGSRMVLRSLKNLGAGRFILLNKHNRIVAGNRTAEQRAVSRRVC